LTIPAAAWRSRATRAGPCRLGPLHFDPPAKSRREVSRVETRKLRERTACPESGWQDAAAPPPRPITRWGGEPPEAAAPPPPGRPRDGSVAGPSQEGAPRSSGPDAAAPGTAQDFNPILWRCVRFFPFARGPLCGRIRWLQSDWQPSPCPRPLHTAAARSPEERPAGGVNWRTHE
jgi:hypothetical protein